MTREELDQLRELVGRATPEPWDFAHWCVTSSAHGLGLYVERPDFKGYESFTEADEEFIAASRSAVPMLLELLDEAVGLLGDVMEPLTDHTYMGHAHKRPGIWDDDNPPERAGQPCEQCALHDTARAFLARLVPSHTTRRRGVRSSTHAGPLLRVLLRRW